MTRRVLIAGGGIAGMAAAWWLQRSGAEVILVERAQAFQPLGHFITLKGKGVHTVEAMGLLEACRRRELVFRGLEARAPDGELLRRVDPAFLARSVQGMVLIRRPDLHAALHEAVRARVDVRFGAEVQALRASDAGVEVELPGRTERVDLFIGADGIHSRARKLVFGDEGPLPMGGCYVAVTVEHRHGLTPGVVTAYLGRGQLVALFPRTEEEISAVIYHGDGGVEPPRDRDPASVRAFLLEAYGGFAPLVKRTFEALDARAFAFSDGIAMVTVPRIAQGRIALLGDAAHCPTFMSGMGASLALEGAHTLARALEEHGNDVAAGVATYERAITPVARGYQQSARRMRRFILERSRLVAPARNALVHWTPRWLVGLATRRFYRAASAA